MSTRTWIGMGMTALVAVAGVSLLAFSSASCSPAPMAADNHRTVHGVSSATRATTADAHSQGKVVNTRCPIMGGKVDPDNTPATLTRQFKGQTVGFCCPGCPGAWDKLTDADKEAKLKTAAAAR